MSYTYSRAMGDLCDAVENVSDTLEKELYAGSGKMHQSLAVKLYREASSAKAALSQLPIEELQLENTYKFLSQVGNYSMAVSERLMNGEEITDEEYENISSLYDFSKELSEDMWELESSVNSGEIALTQTGSQQSDPPTVTEGFSDLREALKAIQALFMTAHSQTISWSVPHA